MADTNTKSKPALADETIKKHMLGAVATGLIPIPVVDLAALAGIQVNLLRRLAKLYGVEFSEQSGKAAIGALVGSGLPVSVSANLGSLAKSMQLIGWVVGGASVALFGAASTYALGKVFVQHFESGNTFLTFDPEAVKTYYAQQYEQGKEAVRSHLGKSKP